MNGAFKQKGTKLNASNDATFDVTGIDSNNDYILFYRNVVPSSDNVYFRCRVLESGTVNDTSQYDRAAYMYKAAVSFDDAHGQNGDSLQLQSEQTGTDFLESVNGYIRIHGANNASAPTHMTFHNTGRDKNNNHLGEIGSCEFHEDSAVNGLQFFMTSGNIAQGEFTLYEIVSQ